MRDFTIVYSNRRTICAEVGRDGHVTVRAPRGMSAKNILKFAEDHESWIEKAVQRQMKRLEDGRSVPLSEEEIAALKEQARRFIPLRVKYFSEIMGLYPSAVKISSAAARFGSCSSKHSLNFSYNLMRYPEEAIDYVIVHELAHIRYLNHGKEFYALIAKYMPDYKKRVAILKN